MMTMMPDCVVEVCDLVKRYKDGTEANRGIDLNVRPGEIVAILGANGAGKTTFLRQLTGGLRPTSGTISIFGIDVIAEPARAKQLMGITPQEAGLFETLSVRRHVELFARLKGLSTNEASAAAHGAMTALDLEKESERRVGLLSGGQRRRVLLALALVGRPRLLVLDEPTTGLDPISRRAVWGVLRRERDDGASIILSTHYLEEAEYLCDRVGIIAAGRFIALGTVAELSERLSGARGSFEQVYCDLAGEPEAPAGHRERIA